MVKIELKSKIREVPDFPKKGILFYDITTLLKDGPAFSELIDRIYDIAKEKKADKVAAIESRGYLLGAPLALKLGKGFVMLRKPGKLPAETISEEYSLEYGTNKIEIHKDAINKGERIILVDDLLATGGTMGAAVKLVERLGGKVESIIFAVELDFLGGRERLKGHDIHSILRYDK